jgi:hypothetical protein
MNSLKERLGVTNQNNEPIIFIISTVMNTWLTDLPVLKQYIHLTNHFLM